MTERDPRWENVYAEIFDADRGVPPGTPTILAGLKKIRIVIVFGDQWVVRSYIFDPLALDATYDPQIIFSMLMDEMVRQLDKALDEEPPTN